MTPKLGPLDDYGPYQQTEESESTGDTNVKCLVLSNIHSLMDCTDFSFHCGQRVPQ